MLPQVAGSSVSSDGRASVVEQAAPVSAWARVAVLLAQILTAVAISLPYLGFSAQAKTAAAYYGVSVDLITILGIIPQAVPIVLYFPITTFAQRRTLLCWAVGICTCCLGTALKLLPATMFGAEVHSNTPNQSGVAGAYFPCVLVGQVVLGIGTPFVLTLPAPITRRYFAEKHWVEATAIGTLAQLVGMGVGGGILPSEGSGFPVLLQVECGVAFAALLVSPLVLVPVERARKRAVGDVPDVEPASLFQSGRALLRWPVVRLLLAVGLIVGSGNSILILVATILPADVQQDGDTITMTLFGCSIVGAVGLSVLADVWRDAGRVNRLCGAVLLPYLAVLASIWATNHGVATAILLPLSGFLVVPTLPLSIEHLSGLLGAGYEALADGIVLVSTSIFGVAIVYAVDPSSSLITKGWPSHLVILAFVPLILLGSVLLYSVPSKKADDALRVSLVGVPDAVQTVARP